MPNSPLVFIHKTNIKDPPNYLRATLGVARRFNPDLDIYLLGDEGTEPYAEEAKVSFFPFKEYDNSEATKLFDRVFQLIKGPRCGQSAEWIKFVFKRWFYMYNFIQTTQHTSFWTFDSDTLILTDLSSQQSKFTSYDCTEQCNGACMNGFINNLNVVKNYLETINNLFQNEKYLNTQKKEFCTTHPDYSFTEMRAYGEYKKPGCTTNGSLRIYPPTNFNSTLLQDIIAEETFDQCLVQTGKNLMVGAAPDKGYEMENGVKKLYFREGAIYLKHLDHPNLIKANSLNMSNVPPSLWNNILTYLFSNDR
tara:strand:+ start:1019 stop:1939 length:921 start_codon:yes stop_codon:yes gene_type:complete